MNVALHPDLGDGPDPVGLRFISVCTGGGGLDLGFELAFPGSRAVCLVEREAFAVAHLVAAMRAGLMAPAPVWSDARTLDGRRWRGQVDFIIGGIPCQPHSVAGKRLGRDDPRDLWGAFRRILVQSGAWGCVVENVPGMLSSGGAERVWRDLRRLGFEVEGGLVRAAEVGAPHERERLFILAIHRRRMADAGCSRPSCPRGLAQPGRAIVGLGDNCRKGSMAAADRAGCEKRRRPVAVRPQHAAAECGERAMGDAAGERRGEGRPEPGVWRGRNAAPGHGGSMADAPRHGGGGISIFARESRRADADIGRAGPAMGDALGCGCDGRTHDPLGAALGRGADQGAGADIGARPIFPPGPGDVAGWRRVIAAAPELEPAVCRVADGLAAGLDEARIDRLRLLGNGVVPLAAGYALRALWARLAACAPACAGAGQFVRGLR